MRTTSKPTTTIPGLTKTAMVSLFGLAIGFIGAIFCIVTQSFVTGVGCFVVIDILVSCVLFVCVGEPRKPR